jgi:hypothetical protein
MDKTTINTINQAIAQGQRLIWKRTGGWHEVREAGQRKDGQYWLEVPAGCHRARWLVAEWEIEVLGKKVLKRRVNV